MFSAQLDLAFELDLIPAFAIALSGCDIRCDFCITGAQSWNATAGGHADPAALARRAGRAIELGARSVFVLGGEPTIHLPWLLEFVAAMPEDVRLVLKTNGYLGAESRELLRGLFDLWCVDYKFGNDACAERLAKAPGYTEALRSNLRWAVGQGEVLVRHLLMPGHCDCCWRPVATWLASDLPEAGVNLRTGFWPAWHSRRHAELQRTAAGSEGKRALAIAAELGLKLVE